MTIYEYKTSLTVQAGSASSVTLNIIGGLLRNVFIKANTSTTVFRFNLKDEDSIARLDYGFHTGMLNDYSISFPIVKRYTANITNANPNDETFIAILC